MKKFIENRRGDYQSPAKAGISLISLVITIIVIIILAAIVIFTGLTTPDKAKFAQLASDLSGLQEVVAQKYAQRYTELSVRGVNVEDKEIYRWIAVGNAERTTSGVVPVSTGEGSLYNSTLSATDKNGNEILWYVKILSDTEKRIVEIDEENNMLGVQLPRYEGRAWKMRLADGLIMLDPPYEYDGKQYASMEDITNGGGTYASSSDSPANAPVLRTGMIPVYYDEGSKAWKKADSSNGGNTWYDYPNKKWANMVTVSNNTYRNASTGTVIPEEDILGYWVWIPRYAYKLNASSQTVDVVFLEGTTNMYSGQTAGEGNEYKVHPAFTDNTSMGGWSSELEGIWVAKFEASNSATTQVEDTIGRYTTQVSNAGTSVPVTVIGGGKGTVSSTINTYGSSTGFATFKPNVTSWRNITVNNIYTTSKAVVANHNVNATDTHMMKNSEWGAVAYLTKSQYGVGTEKVWNNSYYEGELASNGNSYYTTLTGMCEGIDTSTDYSYEKLSKTYNNTDGTITIKYKHNTSGAEVEKTFYRYNSSNGVKGSTTGNIYGVYDMSGGAWEYMASFVENSTYTTTPRGVSAGKYGTKYVASSEDTAAKNLEANTNMYGDAVYETKGWNGDYAAFPYGSYPWFLRGGDFYLGSTCGVFAFTYGNGSAYYTSSFRVVLVP